MTFLDNIDMFFFSFIFTRGEPAGNENQLTMSAYFMYLRCNELSPQLLWNSGQMPPYFMYQECNMLNLPVTKYSGLISLDTSCIKMLSTKTIYK